MGVNGTQSPEATDSLRPASPLPIFDLHQPLQHLQPPAGQDVGAGSFEDALDRGEGGLDQGGIGDLLGELGLD